jgi:hypothetical protein
VRPPPKKKARVETLRVKDAGKLHFGKEDRLTAMVGGDPSKRDEYAGKSERWRDVLVNIPEERLDYGSGWGVCEGEWGANGGEDQEIEMITGEYAHTGSDAHSGMRGNIIPHNSCQ